MLRWSYSLRGRPKCIVAQHNMEQEEHDFLDLNVDYDDSDTDTKFQTDGNMSNSDDTMSGATGRFNASEEQGDTEESCKEDISMDVDMPHNNTLKRVGDEIQGQQTKKQHVIDLTGSTIYNYVLNLH
jgi:hypothetical protein